MCHLSIRYQKQLHVTHLHCREREKFSLVLRVKKLSGNEILLETGAPYDREPKLPLEDKRKMAETLVENIMIGKNEIDITFSYLPSSEAV